MKRDRIIQLKNRGLPMAEIARKMGVTRQYIHSIVGNENSGICSCGKKTKNKKYKYCAKCLALPEFIAQKKKESYLVRKTRLHSQRDTCKCGNLKGHKSKRCNICMAREMSNMRRKNFTKQELLSMYMELRKKMNKRPLVRIWREKGYPNLIHVINVFGSWRNLVYEAGDNLKRN